MRQIGAVFGVAATVALVGGSEPRLADFHHLYSAHITLALTTALLAVRVDTRPAVVRSELPSRRVRAPVHP